MKPLFAVLCVWLLAGSAFAQSADMIDGVAARIERAAASADAVRRCVLPSDRPAFKSPEQFEALWTKEIERTRTALRERLALDTAEIEKLVAPMLERKAPFPDTTPALEVQAYCMPLGRWRIDPTVLMVSVAIETGKWNKPTPRDVADIDDKRVLAEIAKATQPWQVWTSCSSLSISNLVTFPTHWSMMRKDAVEALRRFKLSPAAKLAAHRLLDLDNLFAPTRGSWGELRAFCAANAELMRKIEDAKGKNPLVRPADLLSALLPSP